MLDMFKNSQNLAHASEVLAFRAWQKAWTQEWPKGSISILLTFFFLLDVQFYLQQIW